TLRFFHFSKAQADTLQRGTRLRCFGETRRGPRTLEMVHPEYRFLDAGPSDVEETLTPVYPATEGVAQAKLRGLTEQALSLLRRDPSLLHDWLPTEVAAGAGLQPLVPSVQLVHRPPPDVSVAQLADGRHPAQRRLAFEELLAHQLSLRQLRRQADHHRAPVLRGDRHLKDAFIESLPFRLTGAQRRVIDQLLEDMTHSHPMMRLVQGDVGSGKTVVAAAAALTAVEAGCQAALMAPTELLAEQHFRNFDHWLEPLGLRVEWLSGKLRSRVRDQTLLNIAQGDAPVVVGTHALFQESVRFRRLGLVIVDEQHRFGVHQRLALREKGASEGRYPHQLIMTATPIPRTLAMTAYADLDSSVIDELPPGRKPVSTVAIPETRRAEVVERVEHVCRAGGQVYWVCPLIEESEHLQCQAAEDTAAVLAGALDGLTVGLVHGRMKPAEKDRVMSRFKAGEVQLLVATTVIEVGVDVPNATLMIIENAERLGLAQLHQLRGRVGRGTGESTCVLMYRGPLGALARERLAAMRRTSDGFEIARRDLELRGPGEVLGTRQTGLMQLRIADLVRDADLLDTVQEVARELLDRHPEAARHLIRRWIGDASRFGSV
ncbi:MAG: ATP-dependent DNA helicase RecG, partial [Gammaproteobacteria bacterium]